MDSQSTQWGTFFAGFGAALALVALVLAYLFWRFPFTIGDEEGPNANVIFTEKPFYIDRRPAEALERVAGDPDLVAFAYPILMDNIGDVALSIAGMGTDHLKINDMYFLSPRGGAVYEGAVLDLPARTTPVSFPFTLTPHQPREYTVVIEYLLFRKEGSTISSIPRYDGSHSLYDDLIETMAGSDSPPLGRLSDDLLRAGVDIHLCYTTGEQERFHSAHWDHSHQKKLLYGVTRFIGTGCRF